MKKTRPPSIPLIAENGKAENGKHCVSRQKKNKFLCFALDFFHKFLSFGKIKLFILLSFARNFCIFAANK